MELSKDFAIFNTCYFNAVNLLNLRSSAIQDLAKLSFKEYRIFSEIKK